MDEIKVYTADEAVTVLKVTKRSLYNYIKGGQLKAVKLGREYRITEESLKEFLEHGTEKEYLKKLKK